MNWPNDPTKQRKILRTVAPVTEESLSREGRWQLNAQGCRSFWEVGVGWGQIFLRLQVFQLNLVPKQADLASGIFFTCAFTNQIL